MVAGVAMAAVVAEAAVVGVAEVVVVAAVVVGVAEAALVGMVQSVEVALAEMAHRSGTEQISKDATDESVGNMVVGMFHMIHRNCMYHLGQCTTGRIRPDHSMKRTTKMNIPGLQLKPQALQRRTAVVPAFLKCQRQD